MIHLAIVEDDDLYAEQIQEQIHTFEKQMNEVITVRRYRDGEDIVENYKGNLDIILMDIQMQHMDGMTAAQKIREMDEEVILIFLTNVSSYAMMGYEVDALDYVLKPVSYSVFSKKLARAVERLRRKTTHHITVPAAGGIQKLDVKRIHYIESSGHKMIYHTDDGKFSAGGRLTDLEKELEPYGFFCSSKGILVNLNKVSSVNGENCVVEGKAIPVSRRKKAAFMEAISSIL